MNPGEVGVSGISIHAFESLHSLFSEQDGDRVAINGDTSSFCLRSFNGTHVLN